MKERVAQCFQGVDFLANAQRSTLPLSRKFFISVACAKVGQSRKPTLFLLCAIRLEELYVLKIYRSLRSHFYFLLIDTLAATARASGWFFAICCCYRSHTIPSPIEHSCLDSVGLPMNGSVYEYWNAWQCV
ncbi:hypothetical protein CDAR_320461 [Caerostris darwini]|uniref:Uncharacterized protein n=1 Tax=Caerostris darwini TaxID=1538125 RepID=A0AAV4WYR6_9ARAC|nr:hypothetical protein CDAR_320461 [Caerostris darwini]